jgi:hypothetical protein
MAIDGIQWDVYSFLESTDKLSEAYGCKDNQLLHWVSEFLKVNAH